MALNAIRQRLRHIDYRKISAKEAVRKKIVRKDPEYILPTNSHLNHAAWQNYPTLKQRQTDFLFNWIEKQLPTHNKNNI